MSTEAGGARRERPKRHHQVPQFYLKQFADQKARVHVYDRISKRHYKTTISNVAVEANLYTIEDATGSPTGHFETAIAQLESRLVTALNQLYAPRPVVANEDRLWISVLLVLQYVRTAEHRRVLEDLQDTFLRLLLEGNVGGGSESEIEEFISLHWADASPDFQERIRAVAVDPTQPLRMSNEEWLATSLPLLAEVAPLLVARKWRVLDSHKRSFVTSDNPLVPIPRAGERMGVGFATAERVLFPLSSYRALVLQEIAPDDHTIEVMTPSRSMVAWINERVANHSSRQIIWHPDSKFRPLDGLRVTDQLRGRFINGRVVRGDEWGFDTLREEMIPGLHRVRGNARTSRERSDTS